ncbi:MAG: tetratricopeptide repeat protein [Acidobacteria bacterium]|nr:tetratricopeptide repeat protein [Acidobacteriota bacterium]
MTSQEPATTGKLELRLLGSVCICVDGLLIEERVWTRRKAKALLKILALTPQHQLHREQLMEFLWPEQEPELAANNLNKIIHAARRALEPELKSGTDSRFILTHDQHVLLRAPGGLWIDVEEFEQCATVALKTKAISDYEAALKLYAGELLAEDRYEDWAAARRERLSRLAERLLSESAQIYEAAGQWQQSIEQIQHLIAFNPSHESAHRQLMRLYALIGSRHEALSQFQRCQAILRKELDAEPEPKTIALYEQIAAGQIQPVLQSAELRLNAIAPSPLAKKEEALAVAPATAEPIPIPRKSSRLLIGALIALLLIGTLAGAFFFRSRNQQEVEAIAVLPFTSADANVEYLSDGITESLINSLSHLPNLRVMARTTSFRYKGREVDPQKIGSELKVQALLTGRVLQRGDDLVIQAELIDVKDGAQLWGEQYNRKLADLLSVQSEISREITAKLQLRLTNEQQQLVAKQHTENIEAYQAYLKGRFYWNKRTAEGVKKSVEYYQQAIKVDPNYALAYAGLADAFAVWPDDSLTRLETAKRVKSTAIKAVELDETLAEAHTSLAFAKMIQDRDLTGAEASFNRSLQLNPNYPTAHHWYAYDLVAQGRLDEAIQQIKRAQELDPVSLSINNDVGEIYWFARQYDQAIERCRKTLEMDATFIPAHQTIGLAYAQKGLHQQAIAALKKAVEMSANNAYILALLGYTYGAAGQRSEAEATLAQLKQLSATKYVSPFHLALVHLQLGDFDRVFELLNQAHDEHVFSMLLIKADPRLDKLRADPRYAALLQRLKSTIP